MISADWSEDAGVGHGGRRLSGDSGGRSDRIVGSILFLVVIIVWGARAGARYGPEMYFEGDCPYYISTTLSIWRDFDIDLSDQLRGGLAVHGRQIALGRNGQWYPKHPLLMPLLTVPFYALFGMPGFALFDVLVLGSLAVTLFLLGRLFAPRLPAAGGALLMMAGALPRGYDYNNPPPLPAGPFPAPRPLPLLAGRG